MEIMKQGDKVLMTSDKTWISKEEWDFHKEHTAKLQKEWLEFVLFNKKSNENLKEPPSP